MKFKPIPHLQLSDNIVTGECSLPADMQSESTRDGKLFLVYFDSNTKLRCKIGLLCLAEILISLNLRLCSSAVKMQTLHFS